MIQVKNSTQYYINERALTFSENDLDDPNRVAVSLVSGTVILVHVPGTIDYASDGNYERWTLKGYSTRLVNSAAHYVYAKLNRSDKNALVTFSVKNYNIDGSVTTVNEADGTSTTTDPSADYFYVKIGELTATDSATNPTIDRDLIYDSGLLSTKKGDSETGVNEMWELSKMSTPWLIMAKQWLYSFIVKGFITLVGGLKFSKGKEGDEKVITDIKRSTDSDEDVPISDDSVPTTQYVISINDERYLRKDQDDKTPYSLEIGHNIKVGGTLDVGSNAEIGGKLGVSDKVTVKKGIQIGDSFIPGILTGSGGFFDEYANGEVESLIVRRFLEVPELRFNRVEIKLGDKWNAPGAGVFESVLPDVNGDGTLAMTGTGILKLEEGEYGAIAVGDICMGIFHSEDSSMNAASDSDDSCGNFQFAGFYTCYFRITEIIENTNNKEFKYALRPVVAEGESGWKLKYHPSQAMHFVCYGSFTREDRQTSVYTTRTYTRMLWHQNDWEIRPQNIAMQYGNMENMSIHGLDMIGYSMYLNNIYMTGVIRQIKPNGDLILTANERGEWQAGITYDYYDRVSHNGSIWLCVATNGTDTEPSRSNVLWLLQVEAGEEGAPGVGITSLGAWRTGMVVPGNGIVTMGGNTYIAKKETSNPPMFVYTDNDGERFIFHDGGYVLTGEQNTEEYDLIVESARDGKDGTNYEYIYIRTVSDARPPTPVSPQKDGFVPEGWSDDPKGVTEDVPYEWVSLRVKADGLWGGFSTPSYWVKWAKDGENAILAGLDNEMDNVPLDSDGITTAGVDIRIVASMYYGSTKQTLTGITVGSIDNVTSAVNVSTGVVTLSVAKGVRLSDRNEVSITVASNINGVEESRTLKFTLVGVRSGADGKPAVLYDIMVSDSAIIKKKDGSYNVDSVSATRYKTVGDVMEVTTDGTLKVSIDGREEETTNNGVPVSSSAITKSVKFVFYDAGGNVVDMETVPLMVDGEDGENGEGFTLMGNWKTGLVVPKMGVVTMGGSAFASKEDTENPPLWTFTDNDGNRLLFNDGGYILTGERNDAEYELWVESGQDGHDGADGKDGVNGTDGKDGKQGIQGCVIRDSEWATGIEYRNDEELTSGTRYIDVVLVRDESAATGWVAFKCVKTHTSSTSITTANSTYWEEFGSNVTAVFTSLIIAKNAKITFLQGNQLLIQKSDGAVTAGLSGSEEGEKVRFWAGSETPDDASFSVTEEGVTTATKFRTAKNGVRLEAHNGLINIFGSITKNIEFGVNEEGLAVMKYYDNDGTLLYDLGPTGIRYVKRDKSKWLLKRLTFLGTDTEALFGDYWATARNPLYNTGEDKYQFLSGYIGNALDDAENDRKLFNSESKDDLIPDGWYTDTLPQDVDISDRLQLTSGESPGDMDENNPSVDLTLTVYITDAFYVTDGLSVSRMNVYYNLKEYGDSGDVTPIDE